ncbi:MAG: hypothetical protein Q8K58_00565 [Acidimicrobiales bacterium]|nr:hypothetical protein [Acidimicrobiales bacterium]
MCMSCATSADALLGSGLVGAAGLRVLARQLRGRASGQDRHPVEDDQTLLDGPAPRPPA